MPEEPQAGRSVAGIKRLPALAEGYDLLEQGSTEDAAAFFRQAAANDPTAEALEALGMAAWLLHDEATVFEAREAAYDRYRQEGDALGAGRVAVWLALDSAVFRGQIAVANGWVGRARTLLGGLPEAAEHAWLAIFEAEMALMGNNDGEAAAGRAADAVSIARRAGQLGLEVFALAIEGLALVTTGSIQDGMSKLDEAAAACLAGEVKERFIASSVLCYMMDACDRARDWDRAREWFAHVADLAGRWENRELYAQCRPHYAVVLTWRGEWQDAENELHLSIDDLRAIAGPMAVEGIVRLAELRWRQGRWVEAASLFDQVKNEPLAQVGRAALALDQGDIATALEYVDRCLRRLPESDRLERMPALELQVRACIAAGDTSRATEAAGQLDAIAMHAGTRPARAAAHLAKGLVAQAEGQLEAARCEFEDAIDLYEACGAPFETGRGRLELAAVLLAQGRRVDAANQAQLALDSLERLGAIGESARARRLLLASAEPARPPAPRGLSDREVEVLGLLARGMSNQEIAEQLVLSIRTVQRHVENIYAKTGARGRAAAAVFAAANHLI